jgi:outer membrane protein TolC
MVSKASRRRPTSAALCLAIALGLFPAAYGYAAEPEISLADAVRQAVASNLDLIARRRFLAAAEEEIGIARSPLLPQVEVAATGQLLDSDRSDSARGNNKEESLLLSAELSQSLYDEDSWAGFEIQKHVYQGQVQLLDAFRLEVVQTASEAFLELERSGRVLEIQERNRGYTRKNLETSRARIAAGWSSEREILRWESQLATNDTAVRAAQVLVLQNRFTLNQVRNLPPETEPAVLPATIEEYGFVYARRAIAEAVVVPDSDRRMRDFLVRVGLARSPDLAALDASIAASERQLTASQRAFWVPTVTLGAGVDYLTNHNTGDDFNETEWGLQGVLSFPVFEGGAKFATNTQAYEALASTRTQRRATALSLSASIRAAFAQATGAFESVSFSQRQVDTALKNFELVDASYTLGVASILDLLDAQSQLLAAKLALANATYGFLTDLIAAERAISFYAFLEPTAEVESLLRDLERETQSPLP